jgi:hypothetical protein
VILTAPPATRREEPERGPDEPEPGAGDVVSRDTGEAEPVAAHGGDDVEPVIAGADRERSGTVRRRIRLADARQRPHR